MIGFKNFLVERFVTIGLDPKKESLRDLHRDEIHDILRSSYKKVDGGYSGLGHGSDAESKAIHADIFNSIIKLVKRDGKITTVNLYKDKHGRKAIGGGTNGTSQGKIDYKKVSHEDNKMKRSWSEVSGVPLIMAKKAGYPQIPAEKASKLTGKEVKITGPYTYKRKIGNEEHEKTIVGHPKE